MLLAQLSFVVPLILSAAFCFFVVFGLYLRREEDTEHYTNEYNYPDQYN